MCLTYVAFTSTANLFIPAIVAIVSICHLVINIYYLHYVGVVVDVAPLFGPLMLPHLLVPYVRAKMVPLIF